GAPLRCSALRQRLRRSCPLVAPANRLGDSPFLSQVHQVPALAAVRTNDTGSGTIAAGLLRPAAGRFGAGVHYLWSRAPVLLSLACTTYSPPGARFRDVSL